VSADYSISNTNTQQLGLISAGHDRSDGGLVIALLEMAFAGNCGLSVDVPASALASGVGAIEYLFAEELGMLVEVKPGCEQKVSDLLAAAQVPCVKIATTNTTGEIKVVVAGECVVEGKTADLRDLWEATSFELGKFQCRPQDVKQEREVLKTQQSPPYALTYAPVQTDKALLLRVPTDKPRMAVLREEGTNGDREMSWAFFTAGFDVWDVTLADLRAGSITLDAFRGVAFAGGFSYADVMDSAKGWAGGILFNENVKTQFDNFRKRTDTFSLGVCNGCQLMALLGWVPGTEEEEIDWTKQARFVHNASEKYESRFPTVRVEANSRAMMFSGMEGSQLGIWVAHGEGRVHFPDVKVLETVSSNGQAPLRYVDDAGETTQAYPQNPNGSPMGIAGLCSLDGRHLAMMPHPERVFKKFHWPYMPNEWNEGETALKASPWLKMFQNAYDWCTKE
jgi:phosphoribosylformylglycinamidine synthase